MIKLSELLRMAHIKTLPTVSNPQIHIYLDIPCKISYPSEEEDEEDD